MSMTKGRTRTLSINNTDALRVMFALRLTHAMGLRHWTATHLAHACGFTPSTVNRYLKGEKLPNLVTLRIMVTALRVSCDWLCVLTFADRNKPDDTVRTIDYMRTPAGIDESNWLKRTFAARLLYAIEMRGWTPTQFAHDCGLAHSTVNRYLCSKTLPNLATLRVIVSALDVSCDWLCMLDANDRRKIAVGLSGLRMAAPSLPEAGVVA